jgi:radical SAM superfamily enzyme YgiQ (UPF0313 family)
MRVLLISIYEMGRQPFGLASPASWLRAAGCEVTCVDVAKERLPDEVVSRATLVGIHLPMHTATRLAGPIVAKVRRLNPSARLCAYGLYAPLNAEWLRSLGVDDVLGGEFEEALTGIARNMGPHSATTTESGVPIDLGAAALRDSAARSATIPRLRFLVPDRTGLPPLDRYATLQLDGGRRKLVGYTEASRGCRHLCRHCPVVPVYNGQFRVVPPEIVLADIAAQVRAGAGHVTFGDPDFFNGPTHAMRVVAGLHEAHPSVTYDVTIKIEHLLAHRDLLPALRKTGCLFVTSAVESVDDDVLRRLSKGHTRQDFVDTVGECRKAGLTLVPTFVAFHPWLTFDGYGDLLDTIEALDLVDHVAPIQLAIRLLIPEGSRMLELEDVRAMVSAFDPATLTYPWRHVDARVDALHREVAALVGTRLTADRREIFGEIAALLRGPREAPRPARDRATVPYLNEPWYC